MTPNEVTAADARFSQSVSRGQRPGPADFARCASYMLRTSVMLIFPLVVSCSAPSSSYNRTYIPADLSDAHRELVKMLPAKELEHIKAMATEGEMIEYHMGLGLGIRNQWGLWHDSRLARYFEQLGVDHADDMSGIILNTFWCELHARPFRLDERVQHYQEYWRSMEKPMGGSPKDGARIAWVITKGDGPGAVHIGMSTSDSSYWRYEYDGGRGIEPAEEEDRKDLDKLIETWRSDGGTIEDLLKQ
jgi:hypothetical protein